MKTLVQTILCQMQLTFINDKIIGTIDCDQYKDNFVDLYLALKKLHRPSFAPDEKILVTSTFDFYKDSYGLILQSLQTIVDHIDISNCFICFVTTNKNIKNEYEIVKKTYSQDSTSFTIHCIDGEFQRLPAGDVRPYIKANSINHRNQDIAKLTEEQKRLLFKSKNFCILPWISLFIDTKNGVSPCCLWKDKPIGDSSKNSLEDIWNNKNYQNLRNKMLNDEIVSGCRNCTHQEKLGKINLRQSMNTLFSKYINKAENTITPEYKLKYIDSRFNNLCNLSCRSCHHMVSSSWHAPAVAVGIIDKSTPVFLKAGRNDKDLYNQILEQIDHLDRIYFAGGEPLIIQENYDLLDELDKRQRHEIELVYNTNMTSSKLKGRSIFDSWKNFKNISVGASLDAEGIRAKYLRTGTIWENVVNFRREMITLRPDIDFFISATTGLLNVLHLPDFHRSWVSQELIQPYQFRIQTLSNPQWMRVESSPPHLRDKILKKYENHLKWLRPLDNEGRATEGFESIIEQLNNPIEFNAEDFWKNIDPLDRYYKANLLESFPELVDLPR